jgi:hypothetical protein
MAEANSINSSVDRYIRRAIAEANYINSPVDPWNHIVSI